MQNGRQRQRDLRFCEIAAQTAVRPQAVGGKRARLPVLCAVGQIAIDVESLGIGVILRQIVRHSRGNEYPVAHWNGVAGKLERVGHGARHGRRYRVHTQGFHRNAVRDVHAAQPVGRGHPRGEEFIGFGAHAFQQVWVREQDIEYKGAGARHRVEAGDERPQHVNFQIGPGHEHRVGAVQFECLVNQVGRPILMGFLMRRHNALVQLVHAAAGAAIAGCSDEPTRAARHHQGFEKDGKIVEVRARREARHQRAYLVGHHALECFETCLRLVELPLGDVAAGYAHGFLDIIFQNGARIPGLL